MSNQLRVATLGLWRKWFSWYLHGTMQGSILNGAWFRPIEIQQDWRQIEAEIDYFKPHIIFCHAIFNDDNIQGVFEVLEKTRKKWDTKIVFQEGDPKLEPRWVSPLSNIIDLALVNHQLTDKFSEIWKIPVIYWPYFAMVQEKINSPSQHAKAQVTFSGNVSDRSSSHIHYGRKEFIAKIAKQFDVRIYPDSKIGNSRFFTPEVAATSNVVLGIHQGHSVKGYLDTRPFQYCGSGALYFHDESEMMKNFFIPGYHYVQYSRFSVKSFYDEFNYHVVKNPEAGNKIRQQAFEFCQKYHTSKIRVKFIFDLLDGKDVKQKLFLDEIGDK